MTNKENTKWEQWLLISAMLARHLYTSLVLCRNAKKAFTTNFLVLGNTPIQYSWADAQQALDKNCKFIALDMGNMLEKTSMYYVLFHRISAAVIKCSNNLKHFSPKQRKILERGSNIPGFKAEPTCLLATLAVIAGTFK